MNAHLSAQPSLLALDTSTEIVQMALCHKGMVWTHQSLGGAKTSSTLLPAIQQLLQHAAIELHQLDAIAFGCGPGAFTGLRTACAVAQGLALGTDKPVLPIDTLSIVAQSARMHGARALIWVASDARMNEIYAGCYEFDEQGRCHVRIKPGLYDAPSLARRMADHRQVEFSLTGSALTLHPELFSHLGDLRKQTQPAADALIRLAQQSWLQQEAVDVAHALPLYVRDKVAQTTMERESIKIASAPSA